MNSSFRLGPLAQRPFAKPTHCSYPMRTLARKLNLWERQSCFTLRHNNNLDLHLGITGG